MPEQPPLVGQPDLGAVGELARPPEIVHQRGRQQQVLVQARVQLADLVGERRHRDRVLEQAAEVRVVPASRARRAPQLRPQATSPSSPSSKRPKTPVMHLAGQVLEEPVELVEVPVGSGEESRRILGRHPNHPNHPTASTRAMSTTSSTGWSRNRSTRPDTRTSSPRSNRPASASASWNARAWIVPLRSRSSKREVRRAAAREQSGPCASTQTRPRRPARAAAR